MTRDEALKELAELTIEIRRCPRLVRKRKRVEQLLQIIKQETVTTDEATE